MKAPASIVVLLSGVGALAGAWWCSVARADPPARTSATPFPEPALPLFAIPGGAHGIGFDDMRTDPVSGAVFVPSGVTGSVFAIDPEGHALTRFAGFAASPQSHGHDDGPTSLDFAAGLLFVADRTSRSIDVVDVRRHAILTRVRLASIPDYVRFVESRHELWVTEPHAHQIEVFDLAPFLAAHRGAPQRTQVIDVPGGPEALEIDPTRGVAYTNVWTGARTLAIDLTRHAIRSNWASGCAHDDTQGLALDTARGHLFVACEDGTIVVHDVGDGHELGRARAGTGVDIIAYDPTLHHLYVPASESATLTVFGSSAAGVLTQLRQVPVVPHAHCVAVDRGHTAYVCDPQQGRILFFEDMLPAS